jgi:hypothetical protein
MVKVKNIYIFSAFFLVSIATIAMNLDEDTQLIKSDQKDCSYYCCYCYGRSLSLYPNYKKEHYKKERKKTTDCKKNMCCCNLLSTCTCLSATSFLACLYQFADDGQTLPPTFKVLAKVAIGCGAIGCPCCTYNAYSCTSFACQGCAKSCCTWSKSNEEAYERGSICIEDDCLSENSLNKCCCFKERQSFEDNENNCCCPCIEYWATN